MIYNNPSEIKFDYNGEKVNCYIEGEPGVKLFISCSHPIFKRRFDSFAIECNTSPSDFLLLDFEHPDFFFFHSIVKALTERVHYDFDKETGWLE